MPAQSAGQSDRPYPPAPPSYHLSGAKLEAEPPRSRADGAAGRQTSPAGQDGTRIHRGHDWDNIGAKRTRLSNDERCWVFGDSPALWLRETGGQKVFLVVAGTQHVFWPCAGFYAFAYGTLVSVTGDGAESRVGRSLVKVRYTSLSAEAAEHRLVAQHTCISGSSSSLRGACVLWIVTAWKRGGGWSGWVTRVHGNRQILLGASVPKPTLLSQASIPLLCTILIFRYTKPHDTCSPRDRLHLLW